MHDCRPTAMQAQRAAPAAVRPQPGDALLVVDVQRDFLPGGRLAVAQGDCILPALDRVVALFASQGLPIFASRDWHPPDHCSFHAQGGPWPQHCVAGSDGARFAEGLHLPAGAEIVSKADGRAPDAYSAFDATGLAAMLRRAGVRRLFVVGLATDYCVLHSVVDALRLGLSVVVVQDAIAAVNLRPADGERALDRMRGLGAEMADSAAILEPAPGARSDAPALHAQALASSTACASARKPLENSTS
jgi:nicotinamidase/pyrazinamidase